MVNHEDRIQQIINQFDIPGKLKGIAPLKRGHINETFVSRWVSPGGEVTEYIHQWINDHVFRDVPALMSNIDIVTRHIAARIPAGSKERTLEIVPAQSGVPYIQDAEGEFWRTYRFVAATTSSAVCTGLSQAREAARIMGRFHRYLQDLAPSQLADTIPFFHHTPRRYQAFERSVRDDRMGRAAHVRREIDFALERQPVGARIVEGIERGTLPLRVTHNDMKLNNVLFDELSGEGVCLVDLDTVMGGSYLYDFGDLVRNVSIPADEDEVDLSRVEIDLRSFEALIAGYAECVGSELTGEEIELLAVAPRIMALTLGVRFLNDYLDGDHYFRIHKPEHNLIRARAQFKIVASMEREEGAMRSMIEATTISRS